MLDIVYFAAPTSTDILENAAAGSQLIAQGFEKLWEQTLNGGLYAALMKVAQLFALATLCFYMVDLAKSFINQEDMKALSTWIWPIIIITLMANNGALLRSGTLTARNYINKINNDVLNYTASGANLETAYNRAVGNSTLKVEVGREMERCRSLGGSSQDSIDCLRSAEAKLRAKAPEFFKNDPPPAGSWEWSPLDSLTDFASGLLKGLDPSGAVTKVGAAVWDTAMGGIGEVVTSFVTLILLALNNAYMWCLEFALLLTALLGPIAVGSSLLPFGQKAIFAWLGAIMGVGMAKLSFNIMVGLCAQLVSNAQANQPMIFLLFVGLLSPLLASALGAGGGLAAVNAMAKGGEIATQAAMTVASAGATSMAQATAAQAAAKSKSR
ncbi:MAG: hypothetical protein HC815_05925 [Richelia sp. RM1_1_1]|nr:hypothetical protein [Richelia sp. RM1_1_1]